MSKYNTFSIKNYEKLIRNLEKVQRHVNYMINLEKYVKMNLIGGDDGPGGDVGPGATDTNTVAVTSEANKKPYEVNVGTIFKEGDIIYKVVANVLPHKLKQEPDDNTAQWVVYNSDGERIPDLKSTSYIKDKFKNKLTEGEQLDKVEINYVETNEDLQIKTGVKIPKIKTESLNNISFKIKEITDLAKKSKQNNSEKDKELESLKEQLEKLKKEKEQLEKLKKEKENTLEEKENTLEEKIMSQNPLSTEDEERLNLEKEKVKEDLRDIQLLLDNVTTNSNKYLAEFKNIEKKLKGVY